MGRLRTLEQAWIEDAVNGAVFAIAAEPDWSDYDPHECPTIIRDWVRLHYPHVRIEKVAGFEDEYRVVRRGSSRKTARQSFPQPMFRIGFTEEQAKHFDRAWSSPPLHTPEAPTQFYFIACGKVKALDPVWKASGDALVPVGASATFLQEIQECLAR